ncbi:hypothetical protein D3C74_218900 [compost metagenome]
MNERIQEIKRNHENAQRGLEKFDMPFISQEHQDRAYLLSEVERLQETLEWYADKSNYDPEHLSKYGYIPIDKDEGKRASEALSHLKG